MEFHTPHASVVSMVRPDSSGRILRFALPLTLIPARFPSRSGGNLKEGGKTEPVPSAVPLAQRGEPKGGGRNPAGTRCSKANQDGVAYRNRQPDRIARARQMRREMGEAEKRLWTRLRRNQIGFHFRRQAPVGPYFLDFYCAKARLCIEVDGDLHAQRSAEDRQRDLYLQQLGILTLRVPSGELYAHLDAVVEYIAHLCRERTNLQEQG